MSRLAFVRKGCWKLVACGLAATALLGGCGGDDAGSAGTAGNGGGASGEEASASFPKASAEQVAEVAKKAMNPDVDLGKLAPEIRTTFESAANPLTPEQQKIWDRCIAQTICDTGQGDKTVAYIGDQVQPYYSISIGEVLATVIQSGEVKRFLRMQSNRVVSQFLTSFRQAIAQKVDVIVGEFGALGGQMGPVLAQAKAAGIPVINGATLPPPDVAKLLGIEIRATAGDMWRGDVASTLNDHLKERGITNPTYAMFSGPAGNPYAASWQGAADEAVAKFGWKRVYRGWEVWDPQGQAQAASALLASGKDPDVILTDIAPTQFLEAYKKAGKELPLVMVSGSIDVNALKGFQQAKQEGENPDIWACSSQVWILRAAVVAGLEVANGRERSSRVINYPLGAVPFDDVAKAVDLDVNSNAIAGNLLSPAMQNEALKH